MADRQQHQRAPPTSGVGTNLDVQSLATSLVQSPEFQNVRRRAINQQTADQSAGTSAPPASSGNCPPTRRTHQTISSEIGSLFPCYGRQQNNATPPTPSTPSTGFHRFHPYNGVYRRLSTQSSFSNKSNLTRAI